MTAAGREHPSWWLVFSSALLLLLALPGVGPWPLMWVAFVPLLLFLRSQTVKLWKVFLATFLATLPYALALTLPIALLDGSWWFVSGDVGQSSIDRSMAPWLALLGAWGALWLSLAFTLYRARAREDGWNIVRFAIIFGSLEFLRAKLGMAGYSWGSITYTFAASEYSKQLVAIVGTYGFAGFVAGANHWIADLVANGALGRIWRAPRRIVLFLSQFLFEKGQHARLVYAAIWMCAMLYGAIEYRLHGEWLSSPLRVAVVHSDLPTDESYAAGAYRHYRSQILAALQGGADLVVLPENVFPFFVVDEATLSLRGSRNQFVLEAPELYQDLMQISRTYPDATITLGIHTRKGYERFNASVSYRDGAIVHIYRKRRVVPFAENSPSYFSTPIMERITPGDDATPHTLGGSRVATVICSEIDHPELVAGSADILVSPSNDSVFRSDWIGRVHHAVATIRAVESRAYVLRSSKGGVSSIISPVGRVLASADGSGELLVAEIR